MIDELYDLIGGRPTIQVATESFYKKVHADETLRVLFQSTDIEQLRARQSMFISMLLGGGWFMGVRTLQRRTQGRGSTG